MFTNPFPNAFGLDISDLSAKVVQLRNVSRRHNYPSYQPLIYRSIDLPPNLITNGEIREPELVRKYVQRLLYGTKRGDKKIKSDWVVASLPEPRSFIKHLPIAESESKISRKIIIQLAKKHIPFDEDSYYIDWQIVPGFESSKKISHVLIGAVSKNIANSYTYLLKSLGLGVVAVEIEALSIARAMITASKEYRGEARALLDLGATRSSLIVYDHDSLQFSTSLPFSGERITAALSEKLGISREEAENKKISIGLDIVQGQGIYADIISSLALELINDLKKAIDFYYSHFSNVNKITHITMCGGSANLKRLPEVISAKLNIEAQPGKPWKNLHYKKEIPLDPKISLTYATAIGLALRAADNPFFRHDTI